MWVYMDATFALECVHSWLIEYLTQLPMMRSTTAFPKFLERISKGFP